MHGAMVLVVDDDADILDLMQDYLSGAGFQVLTAGDAAQALACLGTARVDCLLLDVRMPGTSGFDLARQIRQRSDLPILFFSARDDDAHRLRGLGLGADDYIGKDRSPAEVVARVQAVLRRSLRGAAGPGSLQGGVRPGPLRLDFGRLVIDLTGHQVLVDGTCVALTAREFDLLRLLAEHPHQVFTREQIAARLWDGFSDLQAANGLVARLRGKLEREPAHPEWIATVWGVGYRFEGGRRP